MAVYTAVSPEEMQHLLQRYDLGALQHFKGITAGVQNSNYLLKTDKGSYIYTVYEPSDLGVKAEELPFFLDLMEHLSQRKIPCPAPVADRNGTLIQTIHGKPSAITTFLQGSSPTTIRNNHCHALGTQLATMHLAAQDFAGTRPNYMHPLEVWKRLFPKVKDQAHTVRQDLADELQAGYDYLSSHWPYHLPTGTIHGDLFPDNAFFQRQRFSGILDFYFACTDITTYDIAICLNSWCFEHGAEFNITKAKQLLNAYNQVRPLSPEELEALPLLATGSALRTLLSRLYDWIYPAEDAQVKPHDPMEYYHKLRFHRQVKSHREYGL